MLIIKTQNVLDKLYHSRFFSGKRSQIIIIIISGTFLISKLQCVCTGELRGSPFVCPEDYTQCHGGYCIPTRYVCDGQWHCPDGEDEHNCGKSIFISGCECEGQIPK